VTVTAVLAAIGAVTVALGAATRLPRAAAELIRVCIPVVTAFGELLDAVADLRAKRTARRAAAGEAPAVPPAEGSSSVS
jgi:hypothetical protein